MGNVFVGSLRAEILKDQETRSLQGRLYVAPLLGKGSSFSGTGSKPRTVLSHLANESSGGGSVRTAGRPPTAPAIASLPWGCSGVSRADQAWGGPGPLMGFPGQVGFPSGSSGKEPACQCRRHKRPGLHPWVGKIPWRKACQPTPVFLPEEARGQRSLVGYSPRGHKESNVTQ